MINMDEQELRALLDELRNCPMKLSGQSSNLIMRNRRRLENIYPPSQMVRVSITNSSGYLIFGIEDETHEVKGHKFQAETGKDRKRRA